MLQIKAFILIFDFMPELQCTWDVHPWRSIQAKRFLSPCLLGGLPAEGGRKGNEQVLRRQHMIRVVCKDFVEDFFRFG
jgi:hypothetical protein